MISIVTFKWHTKGYRSQFSPATVNTLFRMVDRHLAQPHRNICVTDDPAGIDPSIEIVPLWPDWSEMRSKIGHSYPSCYRRLKLFAPDAGAIFGKRLLQIDLDSVITGPLDPVVDRPEDFVIWGESDFPHTTPCCGSLWMLKTGTRPQVWTEFKGPQSADLAWANGCRGSDQGWIAYILGKGKADGWREATWTRKHGVYSFRKHLAHSSKLPEGVRVVSWHGKIDPWSKRAQRIPWVQQHYQ